MALSKDYVRRPILCLVFLALAAFSPEKAPLAQSTETALDTVPVKVLKVGASQRAELLTGMGSISCPKTFDLGFDDTGIISEILVEPGDMVMEGQILAKLDSSVLESEKRAIQAKLASVEAELRYYESDLEKKESLFSKNALSDSEFKKATLECEKAKANMGYIKAEIMTAESKLKRKILYAPSTGLVTEKHAEVGSVMMPGSNKVVSLIQCSKAWAEIELGEKLFGSIRPGMPVKIKVDALGGRTFTGELVRVAPHIDKKNRTFTIKVEVDNSKWVLRPGMFVRAEIDLSSDQKPLWIPRKAIHNLDASGSGSVFIVKDRVALRRPVQVGKTTKEGAAIVKGIGLGDFVVVEGPDRLSDLDEVTVEMAENTGLLDE